MRGWRRCPVNTQFTQQFNYVALFPAVRGARTGTRTRPESVQLRQRRVFLAIIQARDECLALCSSERTEWIALMLLGAWMSRLRPSKFSWSVVSGTFHCAFDCKSKTYARFPPVRVDSPFKLVIFSVPCLLYGVIVNDFNPLDHICPVEDIFWSFIIFLFIVSCLYRWPKINEGVWIAYNFLL